MSNGACSNKNQMLLTLCLLLFVPLNIDTAAECLFVMMASIATRRKERVGSYIALYNMCFTCLLQCALSYHEPH